MRGIYLGIGISMWRLSPAYDITFSVDLAAPAYANRHAMSVNGKFEDITREDLEKIGSINDIKNYKSLIDKVYNAVSLFSHFAQEMEIDQDLIAKIKKEFIR